VRLSLISSVYF